MTSIVIQALETFVFGVIALGLALFLPAWTLDYWQAWVFIMVFTILLTLVNTYFSVKDPALMRRRREAGPAAQQSTRQKINIVYFYLGLLVLPVLCALDHRFMWSHMPFYLSIVGTGLVVAATAIWFFSKKANTYAGSAIRIYEGQETITTGPYAIVRHPNYVGDLTLLLGAPLALGSWWGLMVLALLLPSMVLTILDEETLLQKELPGYAEYAQNVCYRLVPHIW